MSAPQHTLFMTGASRGIGNNAALWILRNRPDIHLVVAARGVQPGALAKRLRSATGNAEVSEVECELGSLRSVRHAGETIRRLCATGDLPPLATLLLNAGIQLRTGAAPSVDGFETTFAVNVLANVLLIDTMRDALAHPGRIVVTTSDTHFGDFRHNLGMVPGPRWRNVAELATPGEELRRSQERAGGVAYSTSKLAVIYLVHALARRLPEDQAVYSFNPGLVPGTGLARTRGPLSRLAWRVILPVATLTPYATTARIAGKLLAEAGVGPPPGPSGAYLDRGRVNPSSPESYDPVREDECWTEALKLCQGCS